MKRVQKKMGEILIDKGLITATQLKSALEEQSRTREFLGAILLKRNQIKESDLLSVLSQQFSLAVVSLKDRYINWKLVRTFSPSLILDYHCFPFQKDDDSVTVAITNPLDAWSLKKAEEAAGGLELRLVLVTQEDMQEAVLRYKQYLRGNL